MNSESRTEDTPPARLLLRIDELQVAKVGDGRPTNQGRRKERKAKEQLLPSGRKDTFLVFLPKRMP